MTLFTIMTNNVQAQTSNERAAKIFGRITGTPLMKNDSRWQEMTALIDQGKVLEAASIATGDKYFYLNTVKNLAAGISNRDESTLMPLNDFQALVMGVVRDQLDARQLLTGGFRYQFSTTGFELVSRANNNHFATAENTGANPLTDLQRISPQWSDMAESAGLLTTRGWAEAHFMAGTNRRSVEYTFREFLCTPISQWKDAGQSEEFVRRDIDRAPSGVAETYQQTCRSCHALMDGMGGAFARFDFVNGSLTFTGNSRVANKYNQNIDVYPAGYITSDDYWENYAIYNHNESFGWRGAVKGQGIKEFATMIANSEGFSQCLGKRVINSLCKTPVDKIPASTAQALGKELEDHNYNIRWLFARVASDLSCFQ